jgi:hypothetical protein
MVSNDMIKMNRGLYSDKSFLVVKVDVTLQGSHPVSGVAGNHSWADSIRLRRHKAHDDEPLTGSGGYRLSLKI